MLLLLNNKIIIHRIHKWRTRGKKLVQMKTFSELAECSARIPPKITLYGLLFKNNYVGFLLLLMFSTDLPFCNQKGRVYLQGNRMIL